LLYDILSMHPDLVCPRGILRDNKGLYGTQHYGGGEYDHLLANPYPPIEGFKRIIDRPLPHIQQTGRWTADDVQRIRRSFARIAAGAWATKRVMDKAPWYTFLTELLDEAFPDAQHIRCVRHPIDTAVSFHRRMGEPDALDQYGFWGWRPKGWEAWVDRSLEDRATWLAIETMRQAERNEERLGSRCLTVRYETLTAQPHQEMRRVSEYLQLPDWQGRLDHLPEVFPNYNRAQQVPAQDPALVHELRELCTAMGYPVE
jgi:hypothetical protein